MFYKNRKLGKHQGNQNLTFDFNCNKIIRFLHANVHLTVKGKSDSNGSFDWVEAVIDSGILCGITFFTGVGALTANMALSTNSLTVLACAVGVEFLGFMAAKRGLMQKHV